LLGVPGTDDGDVGGELLDSLQVLGCELDGRATDVLLEPGDLGGAGDGHDRRSLGQEPGERDLTRGRALVGGDLAYEVDHRHVRGARLGLETRDRSAYVACREGCVLVDGAGEEAFSEGTERHEPDPQLVERG